MKFQASGRKCLSDVAMSKRRAQMRRRYASPEQWRRSRSQSNSQICTTIQAKVTLESPGTPLDCILLVFNTFRPEIKEVKCLTWIVLVCFKSELQTNFGLFFVFVQFWCLLRKKVSSISRVKKIIIVTD